MGNRLVQIRVLSEDLDWLRDQLPQEIVEAHPMFAGQRMTDGFLVHKLIQYWKGEIK